MPVNKELLKRIRRFLMCYAEYQIRLEDDWTSGRGFEDSNNFLDDEVMFEVKKLLERTYD